MKQMKQVIVYEKNNEKIVKLLKNCDLKEKIILFSVKEIVKNYISLIKEKKCITENYKIYFENYFNSIFNLKINLDDSSYFENYRFVFMFYFLDDEVKKYIQVFN